MGIISSGEHRELDAGAILPGVGPGNGRAAQDVGPQLPLFGRRNVQPLVAVLQQAGVKLAVSRKIHQ